MQQTITIGNVTMTTQAFAIAAMGLVLSMFIYAKTKTLALVIPVIMAAIWQSYNVNCTVVGKCDLFAWALVVIYAAFFLLMILGSKKFPKLLKK